VREVLRTKPADLTECLYLCVNKLGPDHHNIELGVGDSILTKALAQARRGRRSHSALSSAVIHMDSLYKPEWGEA
jgi:DNA ligase-1